MKQLEINITKLGKLDPEALRAATNNGWLKKIAEELGINYRITKPTKYWTKERCLEDVTKNKYINKKDWQKRSSGAYQAARRNGWVEECAIAGKFEIRFLWTVETCVKESKKYNSPVEFEAGSNGAYQAMSKLGCKDLCFAHMKVRRTKAYTEEECYQSALKYNKIIEWRKNEPGPHDAASKNPEWWKKCTSHFIKRTFIKWTYKDILLIAKNFTEYAEFYKKNKAAAQWLRKHGLIYNLIVDANLLYDKRIKTKLGNINNITYKQQFKWADEDLEAEAKKYNTRKEFQSGSSGAYGAAKKRNILDRIYSHMQVINKLWTDEELEIEARKYDTRNKFCDGNNNAYIAARRRGKDFYKKITQHMPIIANSKTLKK